jgi:creatinine amidohydrolase
MKESVTKSGGSTGRPTKSSKEQGEKLHRHLVERLVFVIKDLKR